MKINRKLQIIITFQIYMFSFIQIIRKLILSLLSILQMQSQSIYKIKSISYSIKLLLQIELFFILTTQFQEFFLMIKFQIIDVAAKTYKAYTSSQQSSVNFKFFTNYRLGENKKLRIFDFFEVVIFCEKERKFIITRLNEYNEIEIHCASIDLIQQKLKDQYISDSSIVQIDSIQKECIELNGEQKFQKIVSVNVKNDHFIIVLIDRLLAYSLYSICGKSNEKPTPLAQIMFNPILVSNRPYISSYDETKLYLFQRNGRYTNKNNLITINYKVIDCQHSDKAQLNSKFSFSSPIVAQSTETMLSYIQEVKIREKNIFKMKIYTEFQKKYFKQVIIFEIGQPVAIKSSKEVQKQPEEGQIEIF
ncbi:unnamed protein product (macronuclear) [Paramecium tetraurelia]|uniref:Transmembrane protein n=1 Tax=Paramecium tetraurelia TaxID=5888 RepID=A0BPY1_PARTE|nr:uncharacterized protein GSPATT00005349001 [Paramecium tetraurelia]CAK60598.1 unnamed protein product [Paramecium tetraurelia]|eukprot:XP_001427996.1 hypothetical protein (macronuclear) [Paramecium tetraurelia strain d4-2]